MPTGGPGAGAAGKCACVLFFFLARTQPLSALPLFLRTSPFPTFSPLSPPIGYVRQTGKGTNHGAVFRHRPAELVVSDQWEPSERTRPNWAGEGRVGVSMWAGEGGDKQPQRRRRRWRRRSLVFGVGSLALARLLGGLGCQQRRPYGGGPRRHGGTTGSDSRGERRRRTSGPRRPSAGPRGGEARAGVVPGCAGPRGGARRSSGSRRPGPPRGAAAGRWAPPPGRLTTTLPREPSLRRTRRRRRRGRGRPRRMEERKEEGEAEIQEHGPEHWFSKWERQCLAEAEQDEQLPPELQEEAAAGAQPEHKQQKLWHLFQNSATAVAQLYKDRVCQQQGLSLWVPFQNAATAVTNLYKESVDTHQRSFDIGIQIGYQRRNKDVFCGRATLKGPKSRMWLASLSLLTTGILKLRPAGHMRVFHFASFPVVLD
ncbi:LOW QUALITY PROTEIN: hypothetical protein QTO34_013504, partial [Cnephaeus nilssonii]